MSSPELVTEMLTGCRGSGRGEQRLVGGESLGRSKRRIAAERWTPLLERAESHNLLGRGRKSPVVQARSTADQTAVVRVVMNFTDWAEGTVSMVSPDDRYISRILAGRLPNTASHRNE